ncbi:MAG: OmpA family protein [Deltaproteobacteria bacterium]|nr:OmpA family protein [Deltaproteobacteria bacterium]
MHEINHHPNNLEVRIIGYADQYGKPGYNTALSMRRAGSVASFFKDYGVEAVVEKGSCCSLSNAHGKTDQDRRVEIYASWTDSKVAQAQE